jgi:hypothetical protein
MRVGYKFAERNDNIIICETAPKIGKLYQTAWENVIQALFTT